MHRLFTISVFVFLLHLCGSDRLAQPSNSEVFVFDVKQTGKEFSFSNPLNVSNNPGYDNQPSFSANSDAILFTSIRGSENTDIYEYRFKDKSLTQITSSTDGEYTARAKSPGLITFVREGAGQEMTVWAYDRNTKKESRALTNKEPVAYYDWNDSGGALVWIRYAFMARYVDPAKEINWFVSDAVQPSSPQRIPGSNRFSFVYRRPDGSLWIKEFDPETKAVRPIVEVRDGKIDYCWWGSTILMGSGAKLWAFEEDSDQDWRLAADLGTAGMAEITRLAASPDSKKLAVVSNK